MDMSKKVLTPNDVALELGVCRKTVYQELKTGRLKFIKVGDLYRIPVAAFERYLSDCNQVKD